MPKKGSLYTGIVQSLAYGGEGIVKIDDFVVFVDRALPGQEVEFVISKLDKHFAKGKVRRIIKRSPNEIEGECPHFGVCGGCRWQSLSYEHQLEIKEKQVQECIEKIGHFTNVNFLPIVPSPQVWGYRNKVEFSFGFEEFVMETIETGEISETQDPDGSMHAIRPDFKNEGGFVAYHDLRPTLGFHALGSWREVVKIDQCLLIPETGNLILHLVREFALATKLPIWNPLRNSGFWRHLVLRSAKPSEQNKESPVGDADLRPLQQEKWLILLVVAPHPEAKKILQPLAEQLAHIEGVIGVSFSEHAAMNDSIKPEEATSLFGEKTLTETLEIPSSSTQNSTFITHNFEISPSSFFQTNTSGAEKLYETAIKAAKLTGNETVLDLYCGTGTIGICMAKSAKEIVGLELVAAAVADAKKNAERNGITNITFYEGYAEKELPAVLEKHGDFDIVVIDPPRAGMHPKALETLLAIDAERIVYVSCNPASLARDLQKLCAEGQYKLKTVQPVDMFPHTHHIETVAMLEKS